MSDRNDIIQKLNLYGFAVDTQRWDLFDTVFTPFVDADFGGSAHWTDLAQFKADFAAFHAPFDATQHVMTNHQVLVNGDSDRVKETIPGVTFEKVYDSMKDQAAAGGLHFLKAIDARDG